MNILKRQIQLCISCMEEHEVQMVEIEDNNVFNGESVTFTAVYYYCENTDDLFQTEDLISKNDMAFKNAYRKKMNLLTSDEIVAIRDKYCVSQKDFSVILGWGLATITRYENYQVQDIVHNDVLKKINDDPEWFLELLERSKDDLTTKAYNKYRQCAEAITKLQANEHLKKVIQIKYMGISRNNDITGGVPLDLDKVVEIINTLAQGVDNLYKVKLMKMLWFSDVLNFKRYGKPITGMAYKALPKGAVPECHNEIILLKDVKFDEEIINGDVAYHFKSTPNFKVVRLDRDEIEVIEKIIKTFGSMNSSEIVEAMHEEEAYKQTPIYHYISYKYAEQLSIE